MTYEQFIAGREHDVIPEREVWDAAQAAERKRIAAEMCEWGRLQDLFDEEPAAGPLFEGRE